MSYSFIKNIYGNYISGKGSLLLIALATVNLSCSDSEDDSYVYPPLITEMADLYTDHEARVTHFITDDGTRFYTDTQVKNTRPDTTYRVMCGYVTYNGTEKHAEILRLESVVVLRKANAASGTEIHPVNAISVWQGGGYINMRLEPKTQGGEHGWGYATDSVYNNGNGNTYCLSLLHNQGDDPMSYSTTVYASLPIGNIAEEISTGDSVNISIHTFNGIKRWNFVYQETYN